MDHDPISLHAAARDETRRQTAVAEQLRSARRHTRATVAGQPPLVQAATNGLTDTAPQEVPYA